MKCWYCNEEVIEGEFIQIAGFWLNNPFTICITCAPDLWKQLMDKMENL